MATSLPLAARPGQGTSLAAARELKKSGQQRRQIEMVARIVALRPGHTSLELAHLSDRFREKTRHTLARRLPEAARLGLVHRSTFPRTCSISDRKAYVWYPGPNP